MLLLQVLYDHYIDNDPIANIDCHYFVFARWKFVLYYNLFYFCRLSAGHSAHLVHPGGRYLSRDAYYYRMKFKTMF